MRIFLVFLLFGIPFGAPTNFKAWGDLACYQGGTWCFYAELIERDHFFKDDLLDHMGVRCTTSAVHPFVLAGQEDGDEPFHKFYTISVIVKHNCTKWGTIKAVEKIPKYYPVGEGTVELNDLDMDLTMARGVFTDTYF
ncbi:unnamed protein product [Caenorhabditis nigoni]